MPSSSEILKSAEQWVLWLQTCLGLPMAAPACRPLWVWVMWASVAVAILATLWTIWKAIDYRRKYDAAIRAQMERERIAEPEVMESFRFKEVGDVVEDVTDPHLADKIRAELDRRKLENIAKRPPV